MVFIFGGILLFVFCLGVLCNFVCVVLEYLMGLYVVFGTKAFKIYIQWCMTLTDMGLPEKSATTKLFM